MSLYYLSSSYSYEFCNTTAQCNPSSLYECMFPYDGVRNDSLNCDSVIYNNCLGPDCTCLSTQNIDNSSVNLTLVLPYTGLCVSITALNSFYNSTTTMLNTVVNTTYQNVYSAASVFNPSLAVFIATNALLVSQFQNLIKS